MTTASSSSGLSPEAKEFVPLVQNPTPSIPLYVDENTVASIYSSDQQPLMVQSIYPMMITNSKLTDNIQFPEIEFHIQPSQQQQFHIDSCTNIQQQQSSSNGSTSSSNTSQIVLLPITNPTNSVTLTGYYLEPQIIYSTNEQVSTYYPVDYCEQPLINFSLQQPTSITKSNRISSQQQRSSSFRQHHGTNHSIHRPSSRGGNRGGSGYNNNNNNNNNRNPYYDYNNRRNCSSYTQNSGRGNSTNSKRISSYHQHDFNNYYHSSRSRGYLSRTSQQYDERRKDHFHDYYNNEKDFYENDFQQSSHIIDDGIQFEFRPEDFPSLPINNQQSDKNSSSIITPTNTKPTSSWNTIVSSSRPRSTSPHSVFQSRDQRSDRSRSFNHKLSTNNERKSSIKKAILGTTITTKSPNRASKNSSPEQQQQQRSQSLINNNSSIIENNIEKNDIKNDGFIQTKQQHRRLKRKNKNKEESSTSFIEQSLTNETAPYILDDENAFPTLGQRTSHSITTNQKSENDPTQELIHKSNSKTHQICLVDMFNTLTTSTQENSNHQTSTITINNTANSFDSKSNSKHIKQREQPKSRKSTKLKGSINKEFEDNQKQSFSKVAIEKSSDEKTIQHETDTNTKNVIEM
ncbi:unnamed protein product [Rotaria sp. Silwood2]|nr:unnamed protein product [Rotaria sp. Silwood2]